MKLYFLSNYYPECIFDFCKANSKTGLDFAANNLNKSLIEGFVQNNIQLKVINHPNIGAYPFFFKRIRVPSCDFKYGKSISFLNFPLIKRWAININIYKELDKSLESSGEDSALLLYNFEFLSYIPLLKRKKKNIKVFLLVTDLPEYMDVNNNFVTRINRKIRNWSKFSFERNLQLVDGYILLAPKMREKLKVENIPYVQMEGIYNNDTAISTYSKNVNKVIMYTGNLGFRYGIKSLLEAFMKIPDENYRLWIRGAGEAEELIRNSAMNDNRIIFYPQLTRYDLLKLQKEATILVNPVSDKADFSKYFFPSKTFEYMASGTPTLMYKLKCLPSDYYKYLLFFRNDSIDSMCEELQETCSKSSDELTDIGEKASEFILQNKTPLHQTKVIINFISKFYGN